MAACGKALPSFYERQVENYRLVLGLMQADEIKAKSHYGPIRVAVAMMVSTRLWLGGAVSTYRVKALFHKMAQQVRAIALCRPLLIRRRWARGLNLYPLVFHDAFLTRFHA